MSPRPLVAVVDDDRVYTEMIGDVEVPKIVRMLGSTGLDIGRFTEGQLAISGMMVVRAVYDTLTVPNGDGGYSPYLAQSVTPNDDYTQWDITLRGIFAVDRVNGLQATEQHVFVTRTSSLEIYAVSDGRLLGTIGRETYD